MTTAITILALAATLWIGICLGFVAAIVLSARHDRTWEDERPEWADDTADDFAAWEVEVSS